MSLLGNKIQRIRKFRGLTQKEFGMMLGYDEKSAQSRIADYETGKRTPKRPLIEKMAEVLDVNPNYIQHEGTLTEDGIMLLLLELDEHYTIFIDDCKDEYDNPRNAVCFDSAIMRNFLEEWKQRKKELADGEISKEEYVEWKLNWSQSCDGCGRYNPRKPWRSPKATDTEE